MALLSFIECRGGECRLGASSFDKLYLPWDFRRGTRLQPPALLAEVVILSNIMLLDEGQSPPGDDRIAEREILWGK